MGRFGKIKILITFAPPYLLKAIEKLTVWVIIM
jgi:hypothetical protein